MTKGKLPYESCRTLPHNDFCKRTTETQQQEGGERHLPWNPFLRALFPSAAEPLGKPLSIFQLHYGRIS